MAKNKDISKLLNDYQLNDVIPDLLELPENLGSHVRFSFDDPQWKKYYFKVTPKNLDHLKILAGVPNATARKVIESKNHLNLKAVEYNELPMEASFKFESLPINSKMAVINSAHNLLFGYVDPTAMHATPYAGIVNYMLNEAKDLTVFAADDLIVKDGETRVFKDAATLAFNNVKIYGTGQIVIESQIKLIANSVQYFPA